ncbi:MAG: hypothetical protein OEY62_10470 [Acidimicrobiia bacterium]|nr:hypothetical protein [Acidimicrobiia bacterium]
MLLVVLQVGGGFGEATVTGRELSAIRMELNIEVEAPGGGPVVAHLLDPSGTEETIALVQREAGVFGGFIEVRRIDWVIVFEALGTRSIQSSPANISELGLDPALLGRVPGVTATTRPAPDAPKGYGWLALGSSAAASALVASWFALRRVRSDSAE